MDEGIVSGSVIKHAICQNWLQPVRADKYPTFRAWVLYGACTDPQPHQTLILGHLGEELHEDNPTNHSNSTTDMPSISNSSGSMFCASEAISPVLMIWITLLTMYLVNCTADHLAVRINC